MAVSTAMDLVIEARRNPRRLTKISMGEPPAEILDVIRCAAGDEATILSFSKRHDVPAHELEELARTFLQQMIVLANGKDHRVLGLSSNPEPGQLREHKRWLLRWLHPDRNQSKWESALFTKVSAAADRLAKEGVAPPIVVSPAKNLQRPTGKRNKPKYKITKLPLRRRSFLFALVRHATFPLLIVGGMLFIIIVALGRFG